jgi:hypothetical protein
VTILAVLALAPPFSPPPEVIPPPPPGIPTALRGAVMDVTFVDPSRTAVADL